VNVRAAVIPNAESSELMQQCLTLLDDVPVDAQAAAVAGVSPSQERENLPLAKGLSMRLGVISSVPQDKIGTMLRTARLSGDRWNGIDEGNQLRDIVPIGPGQFCCQWDAAGICDQVVLGAILAAIRGIRSDFLPPKTARTEAESTTAREKSRRSASRSLAKSTSWIFCHTPARCQSCSRFQRVMPQQPISCGKSSQPIPVLSTKSNPARHTRSGTGGCPPLGLGLCLGISGSMSAHRSSVTSSLAMRSSSMTIFEWCGNDVHRQFRRINKRYF